MRPGKSKNKSRIANCNNEKQYWSHHRNKQRRRADRKATKSNKSEEIAKTEKPLDWYKIY